MDAKQVAAQVTLYPIDEQAAFSQEAMPGWGKSAMDAYMSRTRCENCSIQVLWFSDIPAPTHQGWWEFAGKSPNNGTQWTPHTPEKCRAHRRAPLATTGAECTGVYYRV